MGQCGVDAGPVLADGAGEFDERGESTAPGPLQPGVEQRDALGALELKHLPKLLLEQVRPVERRVGLGIPASVAAWRSVRSPGFFHSAKRAFFRSFARVFCPPLRAAFHTSRRTSSSALVAQATI